MSEDRIRVLDRAQWSRPGHESAELWRGRFDGDVFGAAERDGEVGAALGQCDVENLLRAAASQFGGERRDVR